MADDHEPNLNQGEGQDPFLGPNELNQLELLLTFELPSLSLSLNECATLTPGYTFTLPQDVANLPITVKIGGKAVAVGRLVEVSGQVGVQLTEVAPTLSQVGSNQTGGV